MSQYSLGFAQQMSDASRTIVSVGLDAQDAQRAALYTALVSCEIAMKAALEKAGVPAANIRKRNHRLSELLRDLSSCTVLEEITPDTIKRVPASRVRSIVVDNQYADATIGNLLQAEKYGASKFPDEIRYGETLKYFSAEVVAKLSEKLVAWVRLHFDDIQA